MSPRVFECKEYNSIFFTGSISQTLTYPFDVLRRKMQVSGMKDNSVKYNNAFHALSSIIRTEGMTGLYRGLWPNLRKFYSYTPVQVKFLTNFTIVF